jgi:simple sugar transport system ATP-binding protein
MADLVQMQNISKAYGTVQALEDVSVSVAEREIVGLVGDNGAGKSTLVKILSGAIRADSGIISFKGEHARIENTRDAIDLGIETIYQDSALVMELSVARNLFLGREPFHPRLPFRFLDKGAMRAETRKLLRRVGITKEIDPDAPISTLSGGERQAIAIARAIFFEADLIIMDEPTNNLGVEESQEVLRFMKSAREAGHSTVFITHNIYHVFQVVDRIIVLRHGRVAGNLARGETNLEAIERIITGMTEVKPV